VTAYPAPVFAFWEEHDRSVLDAYRRQVAAQMPTPVQAGLCNLATLHHYAALRFAPGLGFELDVAARGGFTRAEVLEVLALAWLSAGPNTQDAVAEAGAERLRSWPEPAPGARAPLPAGWAPDPEALRSGIDPATPELTRADRARLWDWYERTTGEVPPAVTLLADHRPALLKAHRLRWEACARALPKQAVPFVALHEAAQRGDGVSLRQAALLGRAWDMTREQVVIAVTVGISFGGGLDTLNAVSEAIAELLDAWPQSN
jgi:hypothetical protein